MILNLDIFTYSVAFILVLCLFLGLYYRNNIESVRDYAIGSQSLNTFVLIATTVATGVGSGSILGEPTAIYDKGLWYLFAYAMTSLRYIIYIYFVLPKFDIFYRYLSIADIFGKLFDKRVQRAVAVCCILWCFGNLSWQIKGFTWVIENIYNGNATVAVIVSFVTILIYTSFGGIRSVIITDVVQFLIFILIYLPLMVKLLYSFFTKELDIDFSSNAKFYSLCSSNLYSLIAVSIYYLLPNTEPPFTHRILIANSRSKNTKVNYSLSLFHAINAIFVGLVAIIAISYFSDSDPKKIFFTVTREILSPLESTILGVAIVTTILSTTDSLINTASVIFVNDLLGSKIKDNIKLRLMKSISFIGGITALVVSLIFENIVDIVFFFGEYYAVLITTPFLMAFILKLRCCYSFWTSFITGFTALSVLRLITPYHFKHTAFILALFLSICIYSITFYIKFSKDNNKIRHSSI